MDKTLDEALDEFDRWGEELSKELKRMTPEERVAYVANATKRLEQETGVSLHLREIPEPKPASAVS